LHSTAPQSEAALCTEIPIFLAFELQQSAAFEALAALMPLYMEPLMFTSRQDGTSLDMARLWMLMEAG
jgi:hypothetical protein